MIIAAKRSVQWAAVLTMLSASACSFQEKKAETNVKAANSNEVTAASKDSVSKIAVDLLKNIPADANGNRFMSPLSIQTALSMVAEGATDTTLVEMEKLLGSNLASLRSSNKSLLAALNGPKGYKLEVANSMWTRQDLTLKPSFKTILTQNYDASVQPVNFEDAATLALINQWASKKTHGMIPTILDAVDPDLRLLIANATYFEADWMVPFGAPRDLSFTNSQGQQRDIPFVGSMLPQNYLKGDDYQATVRRHKGKDAAMVFIRPDGDLAAFSSNLTVKSLNKIVSSVMSAPVKKMALDIPTLSFSYETDLTKPLQALGVSKAFDNSAEFRNIAVEALKVSQVIHKSFIRVNEIGTKAAAVTSVGMVAAGIEPQPEVTLTLDKPYLFAIVDVKTQTVLFLGSIENPIDPDNAAAANDGEFIETDGV